MNPSDWQKAKDILSAAKDLPPPEQAAYIEAASGGDAILQREVEALLSADLNRVAFLEAPALRLLDEPPASTQGRLVGPYRIVRELGSGGMGAVYLATRADQQFEGRVAIKVLRWVNTSSEIEWRFRQEIQILATLNHPNIAKLYEVGSTDDGSPYFIMEYVEGIPVNRFCDEHHLSVTERLRLFQKICGAAQYAHKNLVVHRDLKPSNILVMADGEPKLLDFGIAKILQAADSADPITVTELHFLTPDYASPEQVSAKPITTASDVYSLGVVLYELLAGERPFPLKGLPWEEIRKVICEQEPEPPSAALGKIPMNHEDTFLKARRLRGDLDTIVLMALRKEPDRRYNSPDQIIEDIERHLNNLPVKAQKDTLTYRTEKFIRRNLIPLGVATLVTVLTAIAALTVWEQRQQALRERDRAQRVADLLVQILNTVDPSSEPISAIDVLNRGTRAIRVELSEQPDLRAALFQTLGDVYTSWGNYDQAMALLSEAFDTRRQTTGTDSPEGAETLYSLGVVAYHKGQFEKAESLLQDSLRIRSQILGKDAPELADNLIALGLLYKERGDMSRTEQLYLEALDLRQRALGPDHPEVGILMHNLSAFYRDSGEYDAAERMTSEALRILKGHYGSQHPKVALAISGLAILRKSQGRFSEAEAAYRRALQIRRKIWGNSHPDVAASLNNLGLFLVSQNRPTEAKPLLIETLELQRKLKGEEHPDTGAALNNLGLCVEKQGNLQKALQYYRSALVVWKAAYPGLHESIASAYNNIGTVLMNIGRNDEAAANLRMSLQTDIAVLGEDHPSVASKKNNLGALLMKMGALSEAELLLNEALAVRRRKLGAEHPDVAMTLHNLAHLRWEQERLREAEALFREVLAIKTKASTAASLARTQVDLADLLTTEGRAAEAEPLIRRAVETFRATLAPDDWRRAQAESVLGDVLGRLGHSEQAATLLSDSHARLKELLGGDAQITRTAHGRLRDFCARPRRQGRPACDSL